MKQKILLFLVLLGWNTGSITYAQGIGPGYDSPDNIIEACSVLPPAMNWSIDYSKSTDMTYSPYQNPVVGDIDDDGIIEILVSLNPNEITNRPSNQIAIFKGTNTSTPFKIITTEQPYSWSFYTKYAIVRTKISGMDKVLIVVYENDRYMRAYDHDGNLVWCSSEQCHASAIFYLTPSFADMDRDGIPEILIGNRVFDSTNGQLKCKTPIEFANSANVMSLPVAEDIFQDGISRFIQGNAIYKPNAALTALTLEKKIVPSVHPLDPDIPATPPAIPDGGRVSLVDMDLDGQLDMIIAISIGTYSFIYIADPVTGTVKASKLITDANRCSYPFIGDIDGDGYPEIVFIKTYSAKPINPLDTYTMHAYKYISGNPILSEFWAYSHTDESAQTAMTLFDFNQDGISEIVYRDERHMRIINGSLKSHIDGSPVSAPYNLASFQCSSGTGTEYPVIADVDGDGQAEIIIVGGNDINTDPYWLGHLWVFKSGDSSDSPWAPTRKVWNQYVYNSLNVNEDLTIPKKPISPATTFAGPDKVLGTADDVRPFNNFLQQQTILDQYGMPLWLAPNGQIVDKPAFIYDESTDKMTVTVDVKNVGNAIFQDPFKITVYKNNIGSSTKYTHTHAGVIGVGQTETITFSIPSFSSWIKYNFLIIKINDAGDGLNDQQVCDDTKSQFRYRGLLPTQQDVCMGKVEKIRCSFTLGSNDSYQWQSSKDDYTWENIADAPNQDNYTPANQRRGIVYYRVVVTDTNTSETVNSESVKIRVRSCKLPVNHNISVMDYYD